jgi:hypothetical protein
LRGGEKVFGGGGGGGGEKRIYFYGGRGGGGGEKAENLNWCVCKYGGVFFCRCYFFFVFSFINYI